MDRAQNLGTFFIELFGDIQTITELWKSVWFVGSVFFCRGVGTIGIGCYFLGTGGGGHNFKVYCFLNLFFFFFGGGGGGNLGTFFGEVTYEPPGVISYLGFFKSMGFFCGGGGEFGNIFWGEVTYL